MIIIGDALDALRKLPSTSVNCCITSPPYYGLRDYGIDKQIGLEQSPEEYINKLVEVFREVRRVLRPDGTLWLNIADSYAGSGKGGATDPHHCEGHKQSTSKGMIGTPAITRVRYGNSKPKDLIGIPFMLALALKADGWYLRQDIIWHKPNPMPESVKDRCTRSHEYIFLFSKSRSYHFDFESIKEPCVGFNNDLPAGSKGTMTPNSRCRKGNNRSFRGGGVYTNNRSLNNSAEGEKQTVGNIPNETGLRNKRDVWTVATQGLRDTNGINHYATFPEKLIEPCVLAGCPIGGKVLDPFAGSGTTGVVAQKHQREFIGIELNPEYVKLAQKRLDSVTAQGALLPVLSIEGSPDNV